MISSIDELKNRIDFIWKGIEQSCKTCTDPDCVGYIWVLPDEEEAILNKGIQTVQVNGEDGPIFLDNYGRDDQGCIIVNKPKMGCPHLSEDRKCTIRDVRPLTCHLYPLGMETDLEGNIVWALHSDCAHVRNLQKSGKIDVVLQQLYALLSELDPSLESKILKTFAKSDFIAKFENGFNNYITIKHSIT